MIRREKQHSCPGCCLPLKPKGDAMPMEKNQLVPLTITALSSDGCGVGRAGGMVVFVPYTAVGDELDAKIVQVRKHYAYGIIAALKHPGPGREAPVCPIYTKCGGCCFGHLSYEAELAAKQQFVADAFSRLGGVDLPMRPILPSPAPLRYRNKVQYPLAADAEGHVCAGFYAPRSHRVVPCADCILQPALLNRIAATACRLLEQYRVPLYDEEQHTGFARHIYLRHAVTTGRVLFCLVANGRRLPHADAFCRDLAAAHPEVESIVLNVNTAKTNVITGTENLVLYGPGSLRDEMAGVPVELDPLSFYQVNTAGAEQLYAVAREFSGLTGGETLLDLYCGAGTIGLSMADACGKLVGVEVVPAAVGDAKRNAVRMGVRHAEFLCMDAAAAARELARRGLAPDVVIVDPPRKGCGPDALDPILQMAPRRIVMVSCNPATAARDTAYLASAYRVEAVQPVDMFPRTRHVECVILLTADQNASRQK